MPKKINDFINNWNVNVKDLSAMHQTGVGFKKVLTHGQNSEIEVLNMPKWMQKQMSEGVGFEECEDKLSDLQDEFEIIDDEMLSSSKIKIVSRDREGR